MSPAFSTCAKEVALNDSRVLRKGTVGAFFAAEMVTSMGSLLSLRLAASEFGPEGLAIYGLARRAFSFLHILAAFGLATSLTKRLAEHAEGEAASWIGSAFRATLIFGGSCACVLLLFRSFFSNLIFGSIAFAYLLPALALMVLGANLQMVLYSAYRGQLKTAQAVTSYGFFLGVVPVLAFLVTGSIVANLYVVGFLWMLSVIPLVRIRAEPFHRSRFKNLLKLGGSRFLSEVAQSGFLVLPSFLVANMWGTHAGGLVAISITLCSNAASLVAPLGALSLPLLAGNTRGLILERRILLTSISLSLFLGLGAFLAFSLLPPGSIRLIFGPIEETLLDSLRLVTVGIVPLGIYYGVRGIIDARWDRPQLLLVFGVASALLTTLHGVIALFDLSIQPLAPFLLCSFLVGGALLVMGSMKEGTRRNSRVAN